MYEERDYGIQIPPDEQAAFDSVYLNGGDAMTEEGLADIHRIIPIGREANVALLDIFEQRVPEKYIILRMCRVVREKLTEPSAVLEEIEAKYAS